MNTSKIIRLILILIFSISLILIISQNIIFSGQFVVKQNFCYDSRFISFLYPENRISSVIKTDKYCYQNIFVEPAYFNIEIPRTFYKAKLELEYKNPDQDIINLGIMKKKLHPLDWRFKIKPLENKRLSNLNWNHIYEQGISLWQKEKNFNSISQFVNNLPQKEKIIVFNYSFDKEIIKNHENIIEWEDDINLKDKDYIIAEFKPSKKLENNWEKTNITFETSPNYINERSFEFIISAPGLTEKRKKISIRNIKVELIRSETKPIDFLKDLKIFIYKKFQNILL